jgi:FlaA1/EpsC-like NDP-sugar epimerase
MACFLPAQWQFHATFWPSHLARSGSVALALPVFITSGLYRAIFRYSGLPAMVAVGRAMLLVWPGFCGIFTFWGVMACRARWA